MLVRTIYAHDCEDTMRLKAQVVIREVQEGSKLSYPVQDHTTGMRFAEMLKREDVARKLVTVYVWNHYIDVIANDAGIKFACEVVSCAS